MTSAYSFDPIWEEKYHKGEGINRYPWDFVVSFIYRHYPRQKARHEVRILEVGCGTGNNLWFAAREGFQVSGIDGSSSAIAYTQKRFAEEGLTGDLQVGDFINLPFESNVFDIVIDRAAITCCGLSVAQKAVEEIKRVLVVGGTFLFNPYSDKHSSLVSGKKGLDGVMLDISAGTLVDVGQIFFYSRKNIYNLFEFGWKILNVQHIDLIEMSQPEYTSHTEWRVIAQKVQ